ncbi:MULTISPECIES: LysE/ArgO family amino acid transporter [unclassified Brenneria]|uniref:LysE/ArgO family amino acid transporter n=1 Tax=unclassified Brenneria TaxID=2634434 RepID=UPI0015558FCB|nr:LysE family transporter [Brenneria sp. L3-3C-1]MEE3644589.1 LysE family transporter [Brenneria sp. L3_3C_1]MEE3652151.1 LysE family transporter [Brenneria sp. HEZEL_4_2_4]NPD02110.1 LysE family transporter [Brenneria sp. hezel4-2-4]
MIDLLHIARAFALGLSLIVAIGAQNIYIIKTGLQNKNVFLAATIAASCDCALIILGTFSMSALMTIVPGLIIIAKWIGVLFLVYYGLLSLMNAFSRHPKGWEAVLSDVNNSEKARYLKQRSVVIPALAFSLLNPHVYLDTFFILGNIGSRQPDDARLSFIIGASAASYIWFYATGYAAYRVSRFFANPLMVRGLDFVVAIAMFAIAYGLSRLEALP